MLYIHTCTIWKIWCKDLMVTESIYIILLNAIHVQYGLSDARIWWSRSQSVICDFYKFTKCCTCHVQCKFRGPETDFMGAVKPEAEKKKPCYFASVCCLKICMFFVVLLKLAYTKNICSVTGGEEKIKWIWVPQGVTMLVRSSPMKSWKRLAGDVFKTSASQSGLVYKL